MEKERCDEGSPPRARFPPYSLHAYQPLRMDTITITLIRPRSIPSDPPYHLIVFLFSTRVPSPDTHPATSCPAPTEVTKIPFLSPPFSASFLSRKVFIDIATSSYCPTSISRTTYA